ncbi:hypothetical protein GCM10010277_78970 [Streptomyces longisporoflavus]|nr:hypothetical protein GCM10010277_78970 [Streptomyces longisporoflavus]
MTGVGCLTGLEGERDLAAALLGLKERSGLSYQQLGCRVFISSSTLHRYCSGKGVPGDFGLVLRIARECGADPAELNELLRRWEAVTGEGRGELGSLTAPAPAAGSPEPAPARGVPHPVRSRRASRFRRLARTLGMALLVLGTAIASTPHGTGRDLLPKPAGTSPVPAPAAAASWARPPAPVDPELFGVTMNSYSGAMPSFRVGALRLWDSETRWSQLEPRRGEFDWTTLDRLLDGAGRQGLPSLFVFGGTPAWAAPDARKAAYPEGARAAPPDGLADWDAFVRALVGHAGARIDAYELWVMANHEHHYNGSVKTLVEMTRRASRIIEELDPDATVVCPSVTKLWTARAHRFLTQFAELGGYQYCDAAGVKLYQRRVTDPPETILDAVRKVEQTFHKAGYHLPLWNTGTTQTLPLNDPLEPEQAADHAVRFYLAGLYARNWGLERMYFYAWGNGKIPIVLQAERQPPTKAGLFVGVLQQWLAHARVTSCGHGPQVSLPDNVWECRFTAADARGAPRTTRIVWAYSGTATVRAGNGAAIVRRLDGTASALDAEDSVQITERPVLIEHTDAPPA